MLYFSYHHSVLFRNAPFVSQIPLMYLKCNAHCCLYFVFKECCEQRWAEAKHVAKDKCHVIELTCVCVTWPMYNSSVFYICRKLRAPLCILETCRWINRKSSFIKARKSKRQDIFRTSIFINPPIWKSRGKIFEKKSLQTSPGQRGLGVCQIENFFSRLDKRRVCRRRVAFARSLFDPVEFAHNEKGRQRPATRVTRSRSTMNAVGAQFVINLRARASRFV